MDLVASLLPDGSLLHLETWSLDEAAAQLTVRQAARTVRTFIKSKLLANQEPSPQGSVMTHPVLVKITGQLFYDDAHVGDAPRGKKGMKAATLWELHPVTTISFAPPPR